MKRPSPPDWLPDWKNAAEYPKPNERRHDWRWGFVRRNEEYQDDWKALVEPHYDFSDHSIGDGVSFDHFRRKFGLAVPCSPSLPGPMMWVQDAISGQPFPALPSTHASLRKVRFELRPYEVAVIVDLGRPLEDQLANVRRGLESFLVPATSTAEWLAQNGMQRPTKPRNQPGLYSLYFRLLDASARGASSADMAETLFPKPQKNVDPGEQVKSRLKAARHMRDKGFWLIRR
jgi:hypothetical protein